MRRELSTRLPTSAPPLLRAARPSTHAGWSGSSRPLTADDHAQLTGALSEIDKALRDGG
ncbi:hypothetical protein ABT147_28920 [Streptomyces sp. NPDC001868]|uniref:hypothetical protein n=1 Tax=Streptomyces sp. NPDC001868 TaxID=3154401 RepID=UPI00332000F0